MHGIYCFAAILTKNLFAPITIYAWEEKEKKFFVIHDQVLQLVSRS